jgi:hypothetical protein
MHLPVIQELKRRHLFYEWAGRTPRPERLFVRRFITAAARPTRLSEAVVQTVGQPGLPKLVVAIWRPDDNTQGEAFRTDVLECSSMQEAHEVLMQVLANFQTQIVERDAQRSAGDVWFQTPNGAASIFTRGNLVFAVRSLQPGVRSEAVAEAMDSELISRPPAPASPPRARLLRLERAVASAPITPVRVELRDDTTCLKLFSSGGEFEQKKGVLLYTPLKPGPHDIDAIAIEPEGKLERSSVRLRVKES